MDVVAVDIGGTHARFALAEISGARVDLREEHTFRTSDYSGLDQAWRAYRQVLGHPLPAAAAIAVAARVESDAIKLTNNSWVIRPQRLADDLGVKRLSLVNDFAAVAYAIGACGPTDLKHVCGPDVALPEAGVISVVGPGTGLGVAILDRSPGRNRVIATEGGHIGFAPANEFEDRLLARLRANHGRVSVERIVCGGGLSEIAALLTAGDAELDDRELWRRALSSEDAGARAALERFCAMLGSAAGDLALAHGAHAVVIAGGLGLRLADHLPRSDFGSRFRAKGRFEAHMAALPVKLITHPQPGLLGAAAAFAADHGA